MLEVDYLGRDFVVENDMDGFQLMKKLNVENAKHLVAVAINNSVRDLSRKLKENPESIGNEENDRLVITFIADNSDAGLKIIRHSSAHLLAYAVQELYGENVKFAIGPAIDSGFYYDFDVEKPFSEDDLEKIENKMREIVRKNEKFVREEWSRDQTLEYFRSQGQSYKVELVENLLENEILSIYKLGKFTDLCRGPHVPSTGYLSHFRLTKVAGAYWRGDSKNKMLQRIYGTAWANREDLDKYFEMLVEAERRDHKKTCRLMDLAHFEPEFAPGAPFLHPKGLYIYNKLIAHMRQQQEDHGYIEVSTPRVMDRSLWEISGHWEHYGEHNYSGTMQDGKQFCIKPMNCPGGILVYKQGLKSYRDLPIKMAEFGKVNRYEASGALNGFLRVREFTQDDAHIFCTEEQLEQQCIETVEFIMNIYRDFGFDGNVRIKLSTRPENRIGNDSTWDRAEKVLADTLDSLGLIYSIFPGEGAFYGPKLEFVLKDALGRDWQMGTLQVDMNLPMRFNMSYVGEDGQKHEPIMLHRAILGSLERFIGIFIEHTDGKFPLWLNPLQMAVATIVDDVNDYADEVYGQLKTCGFQVCLDKSNEKISYKIRDLSLQRIPYILTVGKKERESREVNVRILGEQKTSNVSLDKFCELVEKKVDAKDADYVLE